MLIRIMRETAVAFVALIPHHFVLVYLTYPAVGGLNKKKESYIFLDISKCSKHPWYSKAYLRHNNIAGTLGSWIIP